VQVYPIFEALENRVLPAQITWINGAGGDWGTASNWDLNRVPIASDDAVINQSGIVVTHQQGNDTVHSLSSTAALAISGGGLTIGSSPGLANVTLSNGSQMAALGPTTWADVTVNNSTLTTAGKQTMADLSLVNGGVLTQVATAATQVNSLDLTVSGTVTVDATSRMDASARGFLKGYTAGNTTVGGAQGNNGGSYGGLGAEVRATTLSDPGSGGHTNAAYGDYSNPTDPGSGGGAGSVGSLSAEAGGGLIHVVAGTLDLEGQILANGGTFPSSFLLSSGGGSGGGIRLDVGTITGNGSIHADGGPGTFGITCCSIVPGGGGGGGRIAVYAQNSAGFNFITQASAAGAAGSFGPNGGPGTVYFSNPLTSSGTLLVDSKGVVAGSATPLDLAAGDSAGPLTAVVVQGSGTSAQAVTATSPNATIPAALTVTSSAQFALGSATVQGPAVISAGAFVTVAAVTWAGLTVDSATLSTSGPQIMASLSLTHGGILTTQVATNTQTYPLNLQVGGIALVDATSRIDATAKGYLAGRTTGNTTAGGATGLSGGSYGGLGGVKSGATNLAYGDYANPQDVGSGGTVNNPATYVVAGGGLIQLVADTLQLDGQILVDGGSWVAGNPGVQTGGGSGGGILLSVLTLSGTGLIRAAGGIGGQYQQGTVGGPGGGGGRIALYAEDTRGFDLTHVSAPAGAGAFAPNGGAGTVFVKQAGNPLGTLTIDAGIAAASVTPLGLPGEPTHVFADNVVIQGAGTQVAATAPGLALEFQNGLTIQNSGHLQAVGDLRADRTVTWAGGTISGNGALLLSPGALLNVSGGTSVVLDTATLNNAGTVQVLAGSSLTIHANVTQVAANVLTGGTWNVFDHATLSVTSAGTLSTNEGNVLLSGAGSTFVNLAGLSDNEGSFSIQGGRTFATAGNLLNGGALLLGPGHALTVAGTYTQTGTGSLEIDVAGPPATGQFSQFSASGSAMLAGTLNVRLINGFGPVANETFPVMSFNGLTGDFDAVNGLTLGRFQLFSESLTANRLALTSVSSVPDLADATISFPASGIVGQSVTVSYTVGNLNTLTALGDWYDSLYVSVTPQLTPNALLIGRVHHSGDVAGQATYSETLTAPLPAVINGSYHVILVCDSRGLVPDANRANNVLASAGVITATVADLPLGNPVAGTISNGQDVYYRLALVPGQTVQLTADFPASDEAEFHISYQQLPDRNSYQATVSLLNTLSFTGPAVYQGTVLLTETPGGSYYILLHGREGAAGGQTYTITAQQVPFSPVGVSPDHGSNAGQATVTITGSQFTPTTTVSLVSATGQATDAQQVQFKDRSTLFATFNLLRLTPGHYDVRLDDGGEMGVLPGAFTVTATAPGQIQFDLVTPRYIHPYQVVPLTLEYTNTGDTDLPAPTVIIQAQNAVMGLPGQVHINAILGSIQVVGGSPSLQLVAGAQAGTGGILPPGFDGVTPSGPGAVLPPGYHGSIALCFAPLTFGAHVLSTFNLLVPPSANTPIDWFSQKDVLRPPSIPADAWDAIFANFLSRVGDTIGQYQQVVQEDTSYLSQIGETTTDASQVLAFELQQDADSLPTPTLASATDASAPAPGLPLTFGRTFLQPISGRYQLGPFGRGWADTWDLQATADGSGNVTMQGRGSIRFFIHRSDGTYQAASGDYATLTLQNGAYSLREKDGTLYVFRPDGLLGSEQDPSGNTLTATYSGGLLTGLTHSDGQSFRFSSNSFGRISQLTDEAGRVTTYSYDASGEHLLSVTGPAGTTGYTYDTGSNIDSRHALLSVTNPDGTHLYFTYDDQGRLIGQQKDGGAEAISYAYDVGPGGYRSIDATGASTTVLLNDAGQPAEVINPLNRITQFAYDANYNLVQVVAPTGITSTYRYDSAGNLIQQVDPLGNTVEMTYDPTFNRLTSLQDARLDTTNYSYDPQGNLLAITYPDSSVEQFSYDPLGNLTESLNRRGDAIRYTRDARGLLLRKDYADGSHVDYTYDARGNMLTATDATAATTMSYDAADRLLQITYPSGRFLSFTYDTGGRRTQMLAQDGFAVDYTYDAAGRLAGLTDGSGNRIVTYTYDAVGRLARKDLGNGTYTTYAYDAAGQLLHLVNYAPGGSVNSRFDYTYDDLGRRSSMTTLEGTTSYGYDADGQLTSVVLPGGRTIQYVYDAAGNRVSVTDIGVTTNYTTNNLNQYTAVGTAQLLYDADGNLISQVDGSNSSTYTYDEENRLVSAVTPQGTWAYQYDPLGNRVATTHNGQQTQYLLDPTRLVDVVGEYGSTGNLVAHDTQGLGLTSRVDATGVAVYYDFDAIGSTVGLTGLTGGYVNTYTYLPFGEQLTDTGTIANPFTYVGQWGVMTEDNGLEFMRARFYSAEIGRFIQQDPIGISGGFNQYTYSTNTPTSFIDPSGRVVWWYWVGKVLFNLFGEAQVAEAPCGPNPNDPCGPSPEPPYKRQIVQETRNEQHIELMNWIEENKGKINPVPPPKIFPRIVGQLDLPLQQIERRLSEDIFPGDPNEIAGPGGFGPNGFLPLGQTLPYTIQFYNKPDASAPAQVVVVSEHLDPNLDWSTFQVGDLGFGNVFVPVPPGVDHYSTRIDLRPTLGLFVDVTAGLDLNTGVVTCTFTSIDPTLLDVPLDPLAGFLPPDQAPPQGEAFINYTIQPKASDPTGTVINAKATVVFDAGLPDQSSLDSPTIFNTIDAVAPTSSVAPLPATVTSTTLTVRWSGSDDPGGSGIASYDVFVSDNGGPFTPLLTGTTLTSATFSGQVGHTYGFYSVAIDNVGNRQPTPTAAQAVTQVINPTPPPTEKYQVNDGSAQRSAVTSLTVTFSTRVDVGAGAFQLTQRQPGGAPLDLSGLLRQVIALDSQGRTVVTLTFVGPGIVGGSLPDGWFTLTTFGGRVHDHATGQAVDGAGTGVAGSNQVDAFFRLFGDVNGDGQVDATDRTAFLAAYRSRRGMANFRGFFDFNGDGVLDAVDYYQFLRRYRTRLNPNGSITSF
jgi:RHS repeat-associated protein